MAEVKAAYSSDEIMESPPLYFAGFEWVGVVMWCAEHGGRHLGAFYHSTSPACVSKSDPTLKQRWVESVVPIHITLSGKQEWSQRFIYSVGVGMTQFWSNAGCTDVDGVEAYIKPFLHATDSLLHLALRVEFP